MKQYRCDTVIITKEGWKYLLQRAFAQGGRGKKPPRGVYGEGVEQKAE